MIDKYIEKWDSMTVQQKTYVKHNIFNISTLLAMLTFIIYQARWQEHVDAHIEDDSVHMKFEQKIQVFVPRIELDSRLNNIEQSQKENAETNKEILNLLINYKK